MYRVVAVALVFILSCTAREKINNTTVYTFLDANIPHLDPMHSANRYSSTVNASIFEGLYHYQYLQRPLKLEPLLAEGMPVVSKDGRVYTIKIKKNVFFQNDPAFSRGQGREVRAEDFIFSWKRLADPKNNAQAWWVLDGLIEGLNQWREEKRKGASNYESLISGLKAIDEHTLQIQLTRSAPHFVHLLAMPATMVVAHEVVNKYGDQIVNHPVGTGPYQLQKWIPNSEVQLNKNKKYRQRYFSPIDNIKGQATQELLPLNDKIVVRIITERQPLWLSFLNGELDNGLTAPEDAEKIFSNGLLKEEYQKKGIQIYEQKKMDITFVAMNMEHPVLGKNIFLRKALAHALDRKLILEKFYAQRGVLAQGPIPPGLVTYDPQYQNPLNYDLKMAKEFMVKAGYPQGKGLPVLDYDISNSSTWSRQYAEFIKDQWAQIGVSIRLKVNTWPQFDKKVKEKKITFFEMAYVADYPDAENFLQLFYGKNISPGPNSFNFRKQKYDQLYEKALQLPLGFERNELFKEMVNIINQEVPCFFIVHRTLVHPYHGWLENYLEYPMIYDYYQYLKINSERKQEFFKKL